MPQALTVLYLFCKDFKLLSQTPSIVQNPALDFSANSGVSAGVNNATSFILDRYEEGALDVTMGAGSGTITINSSADTLNYTRIGRLVHIQGQIRAYRGSGNVRLALPFAVSNFTDEAGFSTGSLATYDWNAASSSDSDTRVITADEAVSYARFLEIPDNSNWAELQWDANAYLRFHMCYITDS